MAERPIQLFVVDTAPLITLAAAASLDYLLYTKLPLIIPDAVFYEATAVAGKLGAIEIVDWYRAHADVVRIEPTAVFNDEFILRQTTGRRLARDVGERSAIEIIRSPQLLPRGSLALLLSGDRDVERLLVVDPRTTILLTTWDYLQLLEKERRIQSADAVFAAVELTGRKPARHTMFEEQPEEVREAVRAILTRIRNDHA